MRRVIFVWASHDEHRNLVVETFTLVGRLYHHTMILSVHIPKTAGVSIRNLLKEHFGPGFVTYYWTLTDAWGRNVPDVPVSASCVHGHFQSDEFTGKFPQAKLITWVRDPVDRVVSSYYYRLREPDWKHPVCQVLHQQKLSLGDYAALPQVRNEMIHFFGSKKPEDFHFIGFVEEFERSLDAMGKLLKMAACPPRHDNRNPEKTALRYELDPALRLKIMELNEQDVDLYARCRQIWNPVPASEIIARCRIQ